MFRVITLHSVLRAFCLSLAGWGLVFLPLFVQIVHMTSMPWGHAFRMVAGDALGWAMVTPMIYFATRILPMEKSTWRRAVPFHIATGLVVLTLVIATRTLVGIPSQPPAKNFLPPIPSENGKLAIDPIPAAGEGLPPSGLFPRKIGLIAGPGMSPPPGRWFFEFGLPIQLPVLFVLVAVAHAFHFYVRGQERERQTLELTAGLAKARLDALKMQLQPHFLFNALNSIAALVHKNADAADEMIGALSDFLRCTLTDATCHEVPLEKELEFLDSYLAIELVRFSDRLSYVLDVPPEIRGALVPMLILQPLVENSIRHGLGRIPGELRVTVHARREQEMLRIGVFDDGPSPDGILREGIGFTNIRARLRELHGDKARLEISTVAGFKAIVSFPFRTA